MATKKYLDENGVLYFWQKIKSIFAKQSDLTALSGRVDDIVTTGGEPNVINAIQVNGAVQTVTNKTVNISVPTNNNQIANGAGYQTSAQVQSAINTALSGITGIDFQVVQSLPATGAAGTIYLLSNSGTGQNIYDEYIYVNNAFEKIGTTAVDLSGYVQSSDLVAVTNAEIDTIVAS